jgi:hypothetical protein
MQRSWITGTVKAFPLQVNFPHPHHDLKLFRKSAKALSQVGGFAAPGKSA